MKIGRERTLKSPKYLKKKRKALTFKIAISLGAIFFSIAFVILILNLPFFQIKNIVISTESANSLSVDRIVKSSIEGKYLYLIPKSNFVVYPKQRIIENVLNELKNIDTLQTKVKGITTLNVSFIKKMPAVIVCDGFKEDLQTTLCYLTDPYGIAYEKNEDAFITLESGYFKYFNLATSTVLGMNFIDQKKFRDLQTFVANIEKYEIDPVGILILEDYSYELYLKNSDSSITIVYFDDRIPFDKTLSNLVIFLKNAKNKKIGMSTVPNFNYINLRFGNNVFYSIKDEKKAQ